MKELDPILITNKRELNIIPGDKVACRNAEEEYKKRKNKDTLSKKEKKKIHKKTHKRMKKQYKKAAILAFLGITTAVGIGATVKLLGEPKTPKIENVETEKDKVKKFKENYQETVEDLELSENYDTERKDIEKEINELENKEDVLKFLKDQYIEQYEKQTGDMTLTTEDIKLLLTHQDYVFVNQETGEMITHGDLPSQTKELLQKDNVSWTTKDNVPVYKVENKDGETLDCVNIQTQDGKSFPNKIILCDQYQNKEYESVLENMGMVIPKGLNYWEHYGDELAKDEFIKAIKDFQEKSIEIGEER